MKAEDVEYIRYRLLKARETLRDANSLHVIGSATSTVNRIYYACFYAVSALLLSEGHSSSKHTGVISLFDRLWIKPKRLSSELGIFYRMMFEYRQKGDYQDMFVFQADDIKVWLTQAEEFVDTLSKRTEEKIASA
jgi:hypothetical protein